MDSKDLIQIEDIYGAHNYHPLDVVISKAQGIWMYDVDGHKYLDFPERLFGRQPGPPPSPHRPCPHRTGPKADPDLAGLPQRSVADAGQGSL